jgi:hypothetical protein
VWLVLVKLGLVWQGQKLVRLKVWRGTARLGLVGWGQIRLGHVGHGAVVFGKEQRLVRLLARHGDVGCSAARQVQVTLGSVMLCLLGLGEDKSLKDIRHGMVMQGLVRRG